MNWFWNSITYYTAYNYVSIQTKTLNIMSKFKLVFPMKLVWKKCSGKIFKMFETLRHTTYFNCYYNVAGHLIYGVTICSEGFTLQYTFSWRTLTFWPFLFLSNILYIGGLKMLEFNRRMLAIEIRVTRIQG